MSDVLLGVIIGSVLSIAAGVATEFVRGNREASLDDRKRSDDRRLATSTFQRETLWKVQDALTQWARATQEHLVADKRAFRETGVWGQNLVGEALDERERLANLNLSLLRSRVADDELRERIGNCQSIAFRMLLSARSREEAAAADADLAPEIDWCVRRAGELTRTLW